VIAIIAILAAILFPALARIIHDATRFPARCHSERSEESAFLSEILRCAQNDMNNAG
jgi:type II secretory pathway pseudopilin PulG